MKTMILVILTAAITNNYVLVKFLGICPFLGVSKKLDQATGMSLPLSSSRCWPPPLPGRSIISCSRAR